MSKLSRPRKLIRGKRAERPSQAKGEERNRERKTARHTAEEYREEETCLQRARRNEIVKREENGCREVFL